MGTLRTGGGEGRTSFGCDLPHGSTAVNTRAVVKWKLKDKGNQGALAVYGLSSFVLILFSPSPILHCAVNLGIFMKEKSGKSDLLLYPPSAGVQPFSSGQQFRKSKDGAQPYGFTLALFAADQIHGSSKLPQQSYSYGPQVMPLYLQPLIHVYANFLWVFGYSIKN
ncbi:hypothetical protein Cgig2_006659 [Carnegiea gigantea]|uniref:Uncharacterized protein n=1 Tax=Carnegiea gigantea TaxID=171969 RepID=A0A9Q1Q944_9CARY|nr:hypothetical protein Cgig2_006659 [Carnegiea gigantea]